MTNGIRQESGELGSATDFLVAVLGGDVGVDDDFRIDPPQIHVSLSQTRHVAPALCAVAPDLCLPVVACGPAFQVGLRQLQALSTDTAFLRGQHRVIAPAFSPLDIQFGCLCYYRQES